MTTTNDAPAPAPSGSGVREEIAKIVYAAMKWAAEHAENGKAPAWVERGNSTAQTEARRFAVDIAALFPADPSGAGAENLARCFHDIYEKLAPSFGYETRPDTRQFDPTSANGKLMIAVCGEIIALASDASPRGEAVAWTTQAQLMSMAAGAKSAHSMWPEPRENGVALYAHPAPATVEMREALTVEERLLERTAQVAELFNENRQLRAARCGGRWKALFETAHAALVCIAEAQADALYARKVADELTVASLASDASPRGEAVAWRYRSTNAAIWNYCEGPHPRGVGAEIVEPLYAHPAPATVEMRRVLHKKRGTTYQVLGEAEAQVTKDAGGKRFGLGRVRQRALTEGDKLVVYRCDQTGALWARFRNEFNDGRFEDVAALAPATEGRKG